MVLNPRFSGVNSPLCPGGQGAVVSTDWRTTTNRDGQIRTILSIKPILASVSPRVNRASVNDLTKCQLACIWTTRHVKTESHDKSRSRISPGHTAHHVFFLRHLSCLMFTIVLVIWYNQIKRNHDRKLFRYNQVQKNWLFDITKC